MLSSSIEWINKSETFTFIRYCFDVDKAKEIIRLKPRKIHEMGISGVSDWVGNPPNRTSDGILHISCGIAINWNNLESKEIDLGIPIILIHWNDSHLPIDGWQRIAKAKVKGIEKLTCVVLNKAESKKVTL